MDFITAHWNELLIGTLGSLLATGLVALIAKTSKLPPLPVPLWLVAFIIAFPLVWFSVAKFRSPTGPIAIVDQTFEAQRVVLDGKKFIRCKFDRCFLVFNGDAPFGMEDCNFTAPKLIFDGSAGVVMFQLGKLRNDPNFDAIVMDAIQKR